MRLILYGTETDKEELVRSFAVLPEWCYRKIQTTDYSDYVTVAVNTLPAKEAWRRERNV